MYHRDFSPQNLCIYEFMLPNDADAEDLLVLKITNLRNAKFYYSYGRNSKDAKGGVLQKSVKLEIKHPNKLYITFENQVLQRTKDTGFKVAYSWIVVDKANVYDTTGLVDPSLAGNNIQIETIEVESVEASKKSFVLYIAVIGGVVLVLVVIGVICLVRYRNKQKRSIKALLKIEEESRKTGTVMTINNDPKEQSLDATMLRTMGNNSDKSLLVNNMDEAVKYFKKSQDEGKTVDEAAGEFAA